MNARRVAGFGSIALGIGIAVSAILGPLVLNVIKFRTSDHIENQFIGGEVVSLAIVAPAAIAAGLLWLRGHRLAPALALGPALYAVYTYTTAIIGQEYALYAGNVEKFFPLFAALVATGAAIAVFAWSRLGATEAPMPSDRLRRTLAAIFLGIGTFFALTWAAQIRLVVTGQPPAEYQEGPTLFWLIKLLDFGFIIPLMLATGFGLWRRNPRAVKAAYGLVAFATCLSGAVTGMAVAMAVTNDPSSQPLMLMVLVPATLGLAAATWRLLQSYLQGSVGQPPTNTIRLLPTASPSKATRTNAERPTLERSTS